MALRQVGALLLALLTACASTARFVPPPVIAGCRRIGDAIPRSGVPSSRGGAMFNRCPWRREPFNRPFNGSLAARGGKPRPRRLPER